LGQVFYDVGRVGLGVLDAAGEAQQHVAGEADGVTGLLGAFLAG
jgi:hypothetical protein